MEVVGYLGVPVHIGTRQDLFYTSYDKFNNLFEKGRLKQVAEGKPIESYLSIDSGFRFRFPFPDEDGLKFGDSLEQYSGKFYSQK